MWHFYSHCPLAELDEPDGSEFDMDVDSPTPSTPSGHNRTASRSRSAHPDHSMRDPNSTRVDEEGPVDPPHISVDTFIPLLGLLLMETDPHVASSARQSLVQFLCRLSERPCGPLEEDQESIWLPKPVDPSLAPSSPSHEHSLYRLSKEAKSTLHSRLLHDVVLGLGHLESSDDTENSMEVERQDPMIHASPDDSGWNHVQKGPASPPENVTSPDWGAPLRSFASVKTSMSAQESLGLSSYVGSYGHEADEPTTGRVVAMELITAICDSGCMMGPAIEEHLLPEVARLAHDTSLHVRTAACLAVGAIAPTLTQNTLVRTLFPIFESFVKDAIPLVRRNACLCLPALARLLPLPERRWRIRQAVQRYAHDTSIEPRMALLEISGQLIHCFAADHDVPVELLDYYLGRSQVNGHGMNGQSDHHEPAIRLDYGSEEVAAICAFNFPAVCLSVGPAGWPSLRHFYVALSQHKSEVVQRTLAASLHQVAQIIGPVEAETDLVPIFRRFIQSDEVEIMQTVLQDYAAFLLALPASSASHLWVLTHKVLYPEQVASTETLAMSSLWRTRENVAEQLHQLVSTFAPDVIHNGRLFLLTYLVSMRPCTCRAIKGH